MLNSELMEMIVFAITYDENLKTSGLGVKFLAPKEEKCGYTLTFVPSDKKGAELPKRSIKVTHSPQGCAVETIQGDNANEIADDVQRMIVTAIEKEATKEFKHLTK